MKPIRILLLIITYIISIYVYSEVATPATRYNITYTTIEDGLVCNFIDDIFKDSRGFLWLSTAGGGISRYDGYEFINYDINSSPASLKSNFVSMIAEDDHGRLWIASEGGIDILDISTNKITPVTDLTAGLGSIWENQTISVRKDSKGNIWLLSGADVYKIKFNKRGEISQFFRVENILPRVPIVAMRDCGDSGDMWIGINNNIYVFKEDVGNKLKAEIVSEKLTELSVGIITSMHIIGNEVWFGSDAGLYRFNIYNGQIKIYNHDSCDQTSISQDYITDIFVSDDNQIYVATYRGINQYNPISDTFIRINQCDNIAGGNLNCDFVNCGFASGNIVWIGTEAGGLNKIKFSELTFINYKNDRNNHNTLAPNPVNSIYEDKNGNLWVGTVESGLNLKKKGHDNFTHFTKDSSTSLCHNSVSAIMADADEHLWIGTWGNGISIIDINHPERRSINLSEQNSNGAKINFVGILQYDSINSLMWIGANQGLYIYDLEKKNITQPLGADSEKVKGAIGSVIDKYGRLWLGSSDGLFIVDLLNNESGKFKYKHLKYKLNNPDSGLIEKISCINKTKDGDLWIGSNGYGLYKHTPVVGNEYKFENITVSNGLCSNSVRGIVEDNKHNLWISTNNGLSLYNPEKSIFRNYTKEDGLFCTQFYWNAYTGSKQGNNIYFGTTDGLINLSTEIGRAHV